MVSNLDDEDLEEVISLALEARDTLRRISDSQLEDEAELNSLVSELETALHKLETSDRRSVRRNGERVADAYYRLLDEVQDTESTVSSYVEGYLDGKDFSDTVKQVVEGAGARWRRR